MILVPLLPPSRGARLLRCWCLLGFGILAFAAAVRAADEHTLPPGRYVLDRASLPAFEAALAQAANQVPAMQRKTALRRLRERLDPPSEIAFALTDAGWALRLGENQFPPLQPGAKPTAWTSRDRQIAQVSLRWRGAILEQSIGSGDRARVNAFSFDPAEKVLRMGIELHASQFRSPVACVLRYLPAAPAEPHAHD